MGFLAIPLLVILACAGIGFAIGKKRKQAPVVHAFAGACIGFIGLVVLLLMLLSALPKC